MSKIASAATVMTDNCQTELFRKALSNLVFFGGG